MNKTLARVLGLLVVVMMCTTAFIGCTAAPTTAPATSAPASGETTAPVEPTVAPPDTSKAVELQFWMLGNAPKDLQMIQDKVNEMSKKDLNCTVKFNYTTWTDTGTKYALMLNSGQPVDLLYTATWMNFWTYAKQGAFLDLNDLLPKAAPTLYKFVGDDALAQASIDGKIKTVPCTYKEYINNGVSYRIDLQEKYSLPEPNSLENVEAYLLGIKQNMPSQGLTYEGVNTGYVAAFNAMEILDLKYPFVNTTLSNGLPYGLVAMYATPGTVVKYWGSADFIDDMKMFKRWADEGFWSKSALSQPADDTAFDDGRIVMMMSGENPMKYSQHLLKAKASHPDWKIGYYNFAFSQGTAIAAHPCQNGYALPKACPNPERALMFLEKMVCDKTYNHLTEYGIEGVHYNVVDGYYQMVGDSTSNGFSREAMNGWGWRNNDYMLYDASFDAVKELNAKLDPIRKMNIADGMAEDYTAYSAQRAALNTVMTTYLAPLEAGLVDDVDAKTTEFMAKANEAGLEAIQKAYTDQWTAYIATLKLS